MDFASSTKAAENRTRGKGIVVKSFAVPQRPYKVMTSLLPCMVNYQSRLYPKTKFLLLRSNLFP